LRHEKEPHPPSPSSSNSPIFVIEKCAEEPTTTVLLGVGTMGVKVGMGLGLGFGGGIRVGSTTFLSSPISHCFLRLAMTLMLWYLNAFQILLE